MAPFTAAATNVTLLASAVSLFAVGLLLSRVLSGKPKSKRRVPVYYDVLEFPDGNLPCPMQLQYAIGCQNANCRLSHEDTSLVRLIRVFQPATKTIDVCVYVICLRELAEILAEKHKRGVRIRVITDTEQLTSTGSQVPSLIENGIPVRHNRSAYFMHHKFAIVDGKVLLSGSFNWTKQAVTGNCENLLVTNQPKVVRQYEGMFDRLWQQFDVSKMATH